MNSRNHRTLDRIDRQIIRLLNQDGRMSNAEIARRLGGIPPRTISHRVKGLIARDVIAVRAIVNPAALGYHVLADVFIEVEPGRVREVAETVARFSQVSYVACATGECDVSISLRVRSNEELFDFVTEQLGRIPGVRRTQTHLLPAKLKDIDTWLPPNALDASEGDDSEGP
jgi:Lrp/AsnC family transcriptional regulator for asnA, asnC and gidA